MNDNVKLDPLAVMAMEEAAEIVSAKTSEDVQDGLLDLVGVALKMLSRYTREERIAASDAYDQAQLSKGRKIRNHNRVIAAMVRDDSNFSKADADEVTTEQQKTLVSRIVEKTSPRVKRAVNAIDEFAKNPDSIPDSLSVKIAETDTLPVMLFEESAELLTSTDPLERVDACADAMSCIVAYLSTLDEEVRKEGASKFMADQIEKKTDIVNRHTIVESFIKNDANFDKSDGRSLQSRQFAEIDQRLSEKTVPRVQKALDKIRESK